MISKLKIFSFLIILITLPGCVTEFVPAVDEEVELMVVQGVLTDNGDPVTIKLSTSLPLGQTSQAKPLSGSSVFITDDAGSSIYLDETEPGTYVTNSHGIVGRTYTLHIKANKARNGFSYESFPMKMKPVPPIDSLYYEKKVIAESEENIDGIEECQIYLDTQDPDNNTKFYRWDYSETWMLRLLFDVPNQTCWLTKSLKIYILKILQLSVRIC